ncbi:MAG TPA: hypothetical protein VGO61_17895 [Steroidobacteraceae bacterium]|nr:hypothetical protein [Steroidobacteraceae bacterium]
MVAVVSGSGLGLFTTTRGGDSQVGRGNENVFVNTTNGNLVIQSLDENVAALGLDLSLVRTYNSQGTADEDNNDGWRLGVHQRLYGLTGTVNTASSTIKKVFGDASEVTYTYDTALAAYVSTDGDGAHDTLTWNASTSRWTWTDGSARVRETYNWVSNVGRIQTSIDPNGNTVNYFYSASNLLTRVQMAAASPVVQDVFFDYYTTAGSTTDLEKLRVVSTDASGTTTQSLTRYTYDAQHRLVTVKTDMDLADQALDNSKAYVTTYTYDGTSYRVASITQTGNTSSNVISKTSFTYMLFGGTWRVRTVQDGEARVTTYNYSEVTNPGGNNSQPLTPPGWSVPERLSQQGQSTASLPKVAFDANGNAFALWNADITSGKDSRDITVRRYDRATNTWGAEIVIDTGGATQTARVSQLAVDEVGNALVAWSQSDGAGTYSVYASRYTVASNTWSATPDLLENLSTTAEAEQTASLAVAITSATAAAVSWVQSDGSFNTTYVSRWNGTAWSAAAAVESAANNTTQTTLSMDTAGNVIVTWVQPNASAVDTIYANRFDATAGTWSGPQALSAAGVISARPQIAMDFAGNAFAVWIQGTDLVGRRYDKASNAWQGTQTFDTGANPVQSPSLAMDRQSGAGIVAWLQNDGTADSVHSRRFTGTGTSLNGTVDLLETGNQVVVPVWQQSTGSLATAMRGSQAVVMWCQEARLDGRNYPFDVMAARFNGSAWQAPEFLSNAVGLGSGFFTSIAIDAQGNIGAIYDQFYGDSGVYFTRYSAPSAWSGPNSLSDPAKQSYFSKTATDANGNIFTTWITAAPNNTSVNVMVRRYDRGTNTWGAAVTLSTLGSALALGETQISVDEYGNAIVVWQADYSSGVRALYANRFSAVTGAWGAQELIQNGTQPVDILRPGGFAVQMSGGNAVIAWLQKNGSVSDVWVARYAAGAFVAPVSLESGAGNAYYVSATIDKAGNIGVAWQQTDTTLAVERVYTNRFTASSSTWSGATTLSGTAAATAPQIGYDAAGNGIAIWSQGNDVFANRYDATAGWGTAAAIDNVTGAAESTTLTVDRQGNAIAAWIQTDAGGIKSLYAARYTLGSGWSAAALLETSNLVVRTNPGTAAVVVATAIHGNYAAVTWLQKTPAGDPNNLVSTEAWVNRWNGSAWSGAEMVSQSAGINGFDPSVAVDQQGDTTVTYSRYSDLSQIFVNRYSVNTPWSGESALFLSSESPGTVRTAYDAAGNGFAAWTGFVGGVTTMYVSRYDKATNAWQTPVAVDSYATGSASWWLPTISVDDAGNAVLAWSRQDGTTYNMYVSRYSARGRAWSAALIIDTSSQPVTAGATPKPANIQSAITSETNAAVVWLQSNGSVDDVYVSRWNGLTWTTTLVDNGSAAASNVGVAVDLDGNVTATWLQSDGTAASVFQARYTATSATTGSWSTAAQLDLVNTAVSRPLIGFDAFGNGVAAWIQGNDVYTSRFDRAANNWTTPASISTGTNPPEYAVLSIDSMGNAVLAWVRNDGTANSVYASILKPGGTWSAAALLETSNLGVGTNYGAGINVAVAMRAGFAVVAWNQQAPWGTNINAANLYQARWNGTSWSAREQIDNNTENNGGFYASVGIDAQGNTFAHFPHWRGTDNRTYYNHYTADSSYTQTTVSDGFGRVTIYKHDSRGRLMSVSSPPIDGVRDETRFQYDRDGNVNAVIENAGVTGASRTTVMIYDTRGNRVIMRAPDGTTTRRTYDANNQVTVETVYMAPDLAGGPTQPPLTTRYYYDSASNLRFVVSPDGRVTEHRYFSSGTLGERQYSFVYTANVYSNAAYSMSDLTTWVGQAANVANLERTEYTYDGRGNMLTAKVWATTDANGNGTGTASLTRYQYDQRGLLKTRIEPRGELTSTGPTDYITSYTYDAMRRVTLVTEWLTSTNTRTVRSITYDDANNRVVTTLANGLVSTALYDKSGKLISESKSSGATTFGTTSFAYDYNGRLIMTTLPVGDAAGITVSGTEVRTFVVYDDLGRKVGDVDGDGTLTQYFYNRFDQVIRTIRYSSLLSGTTLNDLYTYGSATGSASGHPITIKKLVDSLAIVPGRDPANDQVVYNTYDSAGRLAATVEVLLTYDATQIIGGIKRFYYNGARLTDAVTYYFRPLMAKDATEFSLVQLDQLMAPYLDASKDRRTRNFYDGDGHLIAMLDAMGYLTENKYDAGGRLIKTLQYANVTPAASPQTADLAALRPALDNANYFSGTPDDEEMDIVSRFYYDGQGRKIGELDGEGYLTETQYDVDGNVVQTARYDKSITSAIAVDDTTTLTTLRNTAFGAIAHTTKFEYDGAGRVTRQIESADNSWSDPLNLDPLGGMTRVQFDANGNGIAVWYGAYFNASWQHVYARRYDKASNTWDAVRTLDLGTSSANIGNTVSISMDDAGNAVIAFSQLDGAGAYSTYAVRYTAAGNSWSTAVAIEASSSQVDYYQVTNLSTSIAGGSAIAVCWVQGDPAAGNVMSTYASIWNGTSWSAAQQLDSTNLTTSNVSIAIDSSRRATAVWLETNGSFQDIRYARYSGTSWAAAAALDTTGSVARQRPQIAFDASGNGIAVWVQGTDLAARRFTVAGGWSGTIVTLATGAQVDKPSLAISSNGDAMVAWAQSDGTAASLYVKRFSNASGTWDATAFSLETLSEPVFTAWMQNSQGIFASMRGSQAAVVWTQHSSVGSTSPANIDTMVSRWNGSGWTRAQAVEAMSGGWGGHLASGAIDGLGNIAAVWNKITGGTWLVRPIEGTVTSFTYDNVDNVLTTVTAQGTDDQRTTQARYDVLGRKTQELSAEGAARIAAGADVETTWTDYGTAFTYDNAGRLVSSTQRVNGTTTLLTTRYFYDADGRLRFIIDPRGQVKETQYDALGNTSVQISYYVALDAATRDGLVGGLLPAGLETTLRQTANALLDSKTTNTWNTRGQILTSTTAANASSTLHYNAFGDVDVKFEYVDASNNYIRHEYEYDRRGQLTKTVWDRLGVNAIEVQAYDSFGRLKQVTDARLAMTIFDYDRLGRQISTADPVGARRRTVYDAFSRTTSQFDALGNETKYFYNDATRRVSVSTPEGVNVATEYSRHGQELRVTTGTNTTTYSYDANGQLKSVSDGLGTLESRTYDSLGREATDTDAHGTLTTFAYDASNRLFTRIVDPSGLNLTTTYTYGSDATSVYVDTAEPGARVTRTRFDQDGRSTFVTAGYGSSSATTTAYTYDRRGTTLTVTEASGNSSGTLVRRTQYLYDTLGRRVEEIADPTALGGTLNLRTVYKYDNNGNVTRRIVGAQLPANEQRSTWYVYNANNQLIDTIDALGGVTENTYDAENRVVAVRRYAAPVSTSGFGDIVTSVSPTANASLDRIERTAYDKDGRAAYSIDALGGVTERRFDRNGNVIRTRLYEIPIGTTGVLNAAQVLDALWGVGNNIYDTFVDNDRQRWTVYDSRDRAAYDIDALGGVTRTTYNLAGDVIETEQFAQLFTGATKDLAALNAWVASTVAGQSYTVDNDASNRTTKYWYDSVGRVRYRLDAIGYLTETSYNDAARTTTDRAYVNGPFDLSTSTAANSIASLISTNTEDRVTTTERDQLGRVIKVTDAYSNYEQYTYDEIGNKQTYRNKLGAIWDYDYDALGRLTDEYSPAVNYYDVTDNGATLSAGPVINGRLRTHLDYTVFDDVWKRTEAFGTTKARTTEYRYDLLGRQVRTYYPQVGFYDSAADSVYRVGSSVVRTDLAPQALYDEVTYDTLGDAVVNRDVAGNYSYRTYDRLGRLRFEVDAETYITAHQYDRYGNETQLIRRVLAYAGTLNGTPLTLDNLLSQSTTSEDRSVIKGYNKLNQVTEELLPGVYWYSLDMPGASPYTTWGPSTKFYYNAFGESSQKAVLVTMDGSGNGTWANTFYFRDRLGRVIAEVDPKNYLTATEYNAVGGVKRKVEYAAALGAPANYGTPTATNPQNAAGSAIGYDRDTTYTYDRLNRLKTETNVNTEYSTVTGASPPYDVQRGRKDVVTTYGYDLVGNRVSAMADNGATVFSYYDALGRTRAVADVSRNAGDGSVMTPITEFRRDARGDVVQQIRHAMSGTAVLSTDYSVAANGADQTTTSLLDSAGRTLRVEDPSGADRFLAYTARGDVAKEWQLVTIAGDSPVNDAVVTIHQYDKLGREIAMLQPQTLNAGGGDTTPNVVAKTTMRYNAFGELEQRGVFEASATPTMQEFFSYDHAGRMWRTNAGDGVAKVYLYDLAGHQTAEIRARTVNLGFSSYAGPEDALIGAAGGSAIRIERRFDLAGNLIEQRLPTYSTSGLTEALDITLAIGQMSKPNDVTAGYRLTTATGNIQIVSSMDWAPNLTVAQGGGYRRDHSRNAAYSYVNARYIYWSDPPNIVGEVSQIFEYRTAGSPGAWTVATVDKVFGSDNKRYLGVAASTFGTGSYEIRVKYLREGDTTPFAIRSGTITNPSVNSNVNDTTSSSISAQTQVSPVITQTNDRWGNAIAVTDALTVTTNYRYDQRGQLIEKLLPSVSIVSVNGVTGAITTSTARPKLENHYDALGRMIASKDPNGVVNVITVNEASAAIGERHADGGNVSYLYDAFGNRVGVTDELLFKTRYTYNKQNLQTKVEQEAVLGAIAGGDAANIVVRTFGYDELGRRVTDTDGLNHIAKTWYDLRGNVRKRATPLGFTTKLVADLYGNTIQETNALDEWKDWTYDYFGRLLNHRELGVTTVTQTVPGQMVATIAYTPGAQHVLTYDQAGLLTSMTSNVGQNNNYSYDAAGQLTRISETGTATVASGLTSTMRQTDIIYDALGRHVRERTVVDGLAHQAVTISYDAAGRLSGTWDLNAGLAYSYDAAGNRTHVKGVSSSLVNSYTEYITIDPRATPIQFSQWNYISDGWYSSATSRDTAPSDYWYSYDLMGRLLISRGTNVANTVTGGTTAGGQDSIVFTYDVAGNRKSQLTYGSKYNQAGSTYTFAPGFTLESYNYDGAKRLRTVFRDNVLLPTGDYSYDAASRQYSAKTRTIEGSLTTRTQTIDFDNDNRAISQTTTKFTSGSLLGGTESIVNYGTSPSVRSVSWQVSGSVFSNPTFVWSPGFDAAGNLRKYSVRNYDPVGGLGGSFLYELTYTTDFGGGENYLDRSTSVVKTAGSGTVAPNTTRKKYNLSGELVASTDDNLPSRNRYFANGADGKILTSIQGGNFTPAQLTSAFTEALNAAGSTVAITWQRYFFANGNSLGSLGFLNLNGSRQTLRLNVDDGTISPAEVQAPSQIVSLQNETLRDIARRIWGDANLWYILAQENGYTDPGAVLAAGTVLQVPNQVVSVANNAAVYQPFDIGAAIGNTAPYVNYHPPKPPGPPCGGMGQIIVLVIALIITAWFDRSGSAFQNALANMGVTGTAASIAASAAASVLAQGIGIAIGAQDRFDWKQVAMAALSAGIAKGMGDPGGALTSALRVPKAIAPFLATAINGAVANALTQSASVALGLQDSFSWRDVAISGVSSVAADQVGKWTAGTGEFGQRLASGLAGAAVRAAMGGKVDIASVIADAFGHAVGNSIADAFCGPPAAASPVVASVKGEAAEGGTGGGGDSQTTQGGAADMRLRDARNLKTEIVGSAPPEAPPGNGVRSYNGETGQWVATFANGVVMGYSYSSGWSEDNLIRGVVTVEAASPNYSSAERAWMNRQMKVGVSKDRATTIVERARFGMFGVANGWDDEREAGYAKAGLKSQNELYAQRFADLPGAYRNAISAMIETRKSDSLERRWYFEKSKASEYEEQQFEVEAKAAGDPNISPWEAMAHAQTAQGMANGIFFEESIRAIGNIPSNVDYAGQLLAYANHDAPTESDATFARLEAFQYLLAGFDAGLTLAVPGASALKGMWSAVRSGSLAAETEVIGTTTLSNADVGIVWGRGIQAQGMPWETYVGHTLPWESRLPAGFEAFDYFVKESGTAVSVKTLNTMTKSKLLSPKQVYTSLTGDIDDAARFAGGELKGVRLSPRDIAAKELRVAVPHTTTDAQWIQIARAVLYGESKGVRVMVTPVH